MYFDSVVSCSFRVRYHLCNIPALSVLPILFSLSLYAGNCSRKDGPAINLHLIASKSPFTIISSMRCNTQLNGYFDYDDSVV
jgi:hypothetical protein